MREKTAKNQYPHGAYNKLIDHLASLCGALPDFEKIKQEDPALYRKFWYHGPLPANFCYNYNKDLCVQVMNETAEIVDHVYGYDEGEEPGSHLSPKQLATKFSKHFKIPLHLFKE